MSDTANASCACKACPAGSCTCTGEAPRKAGECCCGRTCTCGPDCACPTSCGCPAAHDG